jgi:ketosteroid isomerase-like protein
VSVELNTETAHAIVQSAHAAWNAGDIDGVLANYVDDLIYTCNTVGAEGEPITLYGKAAMRERFEPALVAVDSKTVINGFRFDDGVARVRLWSSVKHKATGHLLSGSFRHVVHFRGFKIAKLEDFHDAARMAAFWRMVQCDAQLEEELQKLL